MSDLGVVMECVEASWADGVMRVTLELRDSGEWQVSLVAGQRAILIPGGPAIRALGTA